MTQKASGTSDIDWRARLASIHELRTAVLERSPSRNDAVEFAEIAFRRAAIACGLPEYLREAGEALPEGAAAGAASVLCLVMPEGAVELRWSGGRSRRLPAGGGRSNPTVWLRALACALMVRDQELVAILCRPAHVAAAQLPRHLQDDFWPSFCAAVAALVREPQNVARLAGEAETLLRRPVTRADPEVIRLQIEPLIPLVRALASGQGVEPALRHAFESHRAYFSEHGRLGDPFRLASLEALGLAAWAHDRGYSLDVDGLPRAIVAGSFARHPVALAFSYGLRLAELPEDPTGFLDLEGFPRSGRKHGIVQRGDDLVVVYEAAGWSGMPPASAEFLLADSARPAQHALPRALDAGERILLAELYAERAGAALQEGDRNLANSWLRQAVASIDAVLARIPPGEERVPDAGISNPRGTELLAREPGRFRRTRLFAYRNALERQIEQGEPDQLLDREAGHRVSALTSAEVVRQAVTPLLQALPDDQSGEIRARLRPQPEDYAKVFEPSSVETARAAYERIWQKLPSVEASAAQTDILVFVSPGGMFFEENELSRHFPEGYRSIARQLQPHRVWVAWKYVRPGERSGTAYDGLVWCDDHWCWLPKPYRALRQ